MSLCKTMGGAQRAVFAGGALGPTSSTTTWQARPLFNRQSFVVARSGNRPFGPVGVLSPDPRRTAVGVANMLSLPLSFSLVRMPAVLCNSHCLTEIGRSGGADD